MKCGVLSVVFEVRAALAVDAARRGLARGDGPRRAYLAFDRALFRVATGLARETWGLARPALGDLGLESSRAAERTCGRAVN